MNQELDIEFDVALSFAGEDRDYVRQVASGLRQRKVSTFFDEHDKVSLWGRNLYDHLHDVYYKKARFTVMFISSHYAMQLWTNHERQSAQARAFRERREYILPVRFDDTEIPGVLDTVGYIDLRTTEPGELVDLICRKVASLGVPLHDPSNPALKTIHAFLRGGRRKFSSADHPKAKGITITVDYPKSWLASEAERPNVVQKIFSEEGRGFEAAMIIVKNLPFPIEPSEDEIKEVFDPKGLDEMIPPNTTFIDGDRTQIDGLHGAWMRFHGETDRAGMKFRFVGLEYGFYCLKKLILLSFQVGTFAHEPIENVFGRYDSFQPLFFLMANSVIVHNKWE